MVGIDGRRHLPISTAQSACTRRRRGPLRRTTPYCAAGTYQPSTNALGADPPASTPTPDQWLFHRQSAQTACSTGTYHTPDSIDVSRDGHCLDADEGHYVLHYSGHRGVGPDGLRAGNLPAIHRPCIDACCDLFKTPNLQHPDSPAASCLVLADAGHYVASKTVRPDRLLGGHLPAIHRPGASTPTRATTSHASPPRPPARRDLTQPPASTPTRATTSPPRASPRRPPAPPAPTAIHRPVRLPRRRRGPLRRLPPASPPRPPARRAPTNHPPASPPASTPTRATTSPQPASRPRTPAPTGTYQPSTGQSADCLDADAGHYVASTGQSAQTACAAGTYQIHRPVRLPRRRPRPLRRHHRPVLPRRPARREPTNHPPASPPASTPTRPLRRLNRATSQTACAAGTYHTGSTGQSACLDADAGHYVASTGQSAQVACADGHLPAIHRPVRLPRRRRGPLRRLHRPPPRPPARPAPTSHPRSPPASTPTTSTAPPRPPSVACAAGSYNPDTGSCIDASTELSPASPPRRPARLAPISPMGQSACLDADAGHYVHHAPSTGLRGWHLPAIHRPVRSTPPIT